VIGHGFLAAGMVMIALVTSFPLLIVTQVLWGLGWAFCGGADVAWLNDELNRPERIDRVLTARARWDLLGQSTGLVAFGVLGWAIGIATATVISGVAMALLGGFVAVRFTEVNFTPVRRDRWNASKAVFRQGLALSSRDHEIRLVLLTWLIVNALGAVSWLHTRQLVTLGFPSDPTLWYTALMIVSYLAGVGALRLVEARIDTAGAARRSYALACLVGAVGLLVIAYAPNALIGSVGVVLIAGIAANVTRAVSVVWVNRRTTSEVRATVHSFLSQVGTLGSSLGGVPLAGIAKAAGSAVALTAAAALHAGAGVMVTWSRAGREPRRGGR
jgi:MFS family permease